MWGEIFFHHQAHVYAVSAHFGGLILLSRRTFAHTPDMLALLILLHQVSIENIAAVHMSIISRLLLLGLSCYQTRASFTHKSHEGIELAVS